MRVCPKCDYKDPDYWKPSYNNNPQGAVDCARFSELEMAEPDFAAQLLQSRGAVICDSHFAYLYGKKAVYVKRVWKQLYLIGGMSVFNIPHERRSRYSAHKIRGQKRLLEVSNTP